jgi:hypothetical protein
MSSAGKWEIIVSTGGYPAWCELRHDGEVLARIHHNQLRDLEYAVSKAMREARDALRQPSGDPHRYSDEV